MKTINVLIMRPIEKELLAQISSISSLINIMDASSYFNLAQPGEEINQSKEKLILAT